MNFAVGWGQDACSFFRNPEVSPGQSINIMTEHFMALLNYFIKNVSMVTRIKSRPLPSSYIIHYYHKHLMKQTFNQKNRELLKKLNRVKESYYNFKTHLDHT